MSKKKKNKEPRSSVSADVAEERDEQDESASGGHDEAAQVHASDMAHGGHDPVEADRPRVGLIALVTVASCVTLIVATVFVRELFNCWGRAELQAKVSVQPEQLKDLRATEKHRLSRYQWVSQKDGVVRVPVDRAIELTMAAYRNPLPVVDPPKLEAPPPKPEDIKPEEKPEEKKGEEGKTDKGKDGEKGKKDGKKGDPMEGRK